MPQAILMYLAVYRFGPRWNLDYTFYCKPGWRCARPEEHKYHIKDLPPSFNEAQFHEIVDKVKAFNLLSEDERETEINEYKDRLDSYFRDDVEQYLVIMEPIYKFQEGMRRLWGP